MQGRLSDLPLLVVLLGGVALLAWVPAGHAAILGDHAVAQAFMYSGLLLLVLAVMLGIVTRGVRARRAAHSRLVSLVGAYLGLPLAMALPVAQAVPDTSFANAWFEMLSTFTTTGATVYEPGRLPPSVHLWRALTAWFGGYFILLCAHAVLAPLNLGGAEVISGRLPGRAAFGGAQPSRATEPLGRLPRFAFQILPVYAALTLALWVALLIAGEDGLLALSHAMGTVSTSGVSAGIGLSVTGSGFAGEVLILCFLCLALSRRLMPIGAAEPLAALRRDPELRLALVLVAVVVAVLLLRHVSFGTAQRELSTMAGLVQAFWGATFTAVSFLTTTGYESVWWTSAREWAGLGAPGLLLLGLAIVGGGVATTAGGVKLLRVYALFRHGERELERIIHPSSVGGRGAEARRLRRDGAYMAWVFFMLFGISIAVTTGALTLAGLTFDKALVLGLAALTTTGPLAVVAGPEPVSYATLSGLAKLILGAAMIVGRLETLALIALLSPTGWRR